MHDEDSTLSWCPHQQACYLAGLQAALGEHMHKGHDLSVAHELHEAVAAQDEIAILGLQLQRSDMNSCQLLIPLTTNPSTYLYT